MYLKYEKGLTQGREEFSAIWIISENLLYLLMWTLAGYLLWPLWQPSGWPVIGILWIVLVLVVQVLLKKHNCSGCYYYDKWCHLGWGKLSSLLFKQNSGSLELGLKLSLFYIITPPAVTILSIAYAFIKHQGLIYWAAIGLYLVLNIITFPIRKHGCGQCRMRRVCPGSASKK